jgi:hypothetical protein
MASDTMKASAHRGKSKIVTAKHNDQSFDISKASHIHPEESYLNEYYTYYAGKFTDDTSFTPDITDPTIDPYEEWEKELEKRDFEKSRRAYFNNEYGKALEAQNKKYEKSGHKKRDTKTMDDWIKSTQHAPTEEIVSIGNIWLKDEIDKEEAKAAMRDYVDKIQKWSKANGDHVVVLDYAFHLNEDGAPHAHITTTYEYEDDNGIKQVSKGKALKAAGLEPPRTLTLEDTLKAAKDKFEKANDTVKAAKVDIALRENEDINKSITETTKKMTLGELLKAADIDITNKEAVEEAAYVKIGKKKGYTLEDTLNWTIEETLKEERFNNRQITFTEICREMWQDACDDHGFDVDREVEPSRQHQDKNAYIDSQEAKQREAEAAAAIKRYERVTKQSLEYRAEREAETERIKKEYEQKTAEVVKAKERYEQAEATIEPRIKEGIEKGIAEIKAATRLDPEYEKALDRQMNKYISRFTFDNVEKAVNEKVKTYNEKKTSN